MGKRIIIVKGLKPKVIHIYIYIYNRICTCLHSLRVPDNVILIWYGLILRDKSYRVVKIKDNFLKLHLDPQLD